MTDRRKLDSRGRRTNRRLTITALLLTLTAMLLGLLFVFNTTGGTLFLFSAVAPVLVLVSIVIFAVVTIQEFRRSHKLFVIECYPAGGTIFREGDAGDCAYFIREGEVEVIDEKDHTVLAKLGAGEYFGEMALLAEAPRSATVRAISPVRVAVIDKENFLRMMRLLPAVEDAISRTAEERTQRDGNRNIG